jgi:hypothetical protein
VHVRVAVHKASAEMKTKAARGAGGVAMGNKGLRVRLALLASVGAGGVASQGAGAVLCLLSSPPHPFPLDLVCARDYIGANANRGKPG